MTDSIGNIRRDFCTETAQTINYTSPALKSILGANFGLTDAIQQRPAPPSEGVLAAVAAHRDGREEIPDTTHAVFWTMAPAEGRRSYVAKS